MSRSPGRGVGKDGAGGGTRTLTSLRSTDFLTGYGFRRPGIAGFAVWTIPSPYPPSGVRCCPSSLYTFPEAGPGLARDCHFTGFPEFGQFCIASFPASTQVCSSPLRLPFRHARIFGEQMIRLDLWLCKGDRQWQPGHRGARRRHFQRPSGLVRSECLDFVGRGRMTLMVSIFFARGFSSVASFSAFLEARATLRFFRRSKATTAPGMLLH